MVHFSTVTNPRTETCIGDAVAQVTDTDKGRWKVSVAFMKHGPTFFEMKAMWRIGYGRTMEAALWEACKEMKAALAS